MGGLDAAWDQAGEVRGCAVAVKSVPVQTLASGARRTISRWEGEAVLDRMAERIAARPDILDRHRETVEHPFGSIKQWMNQGAFLTRGLASVNAEFSLTSIAYNLRRAITIRGIPAMLQAMQA